MIFNVEKARSAASGACDFAQATDNKRRDVRQVSSTENEGISLLKVERTVDYSVVNYDIGTHTALRHAIQDSFSLLWMLSASSNCIYHTTIRSNIRRWPFLLHTIQ